MQLQRVIQPGDFGSAVKIATVTAGLPTGRVLYVDFKGTSHILDFLNWNLELNHAMTQDPDFFVHGGGAGTLHAANFWLEQDLLDGLQKARANGVQRVIFTGHSLGGMYAAVLLFLFWKKMDGALPDVAREFKAFAQKRAVNYINENDPCPRAWGAINLCQLVEVAAKRLVDDLGSIKGFVASQAVAAAAQQVLDRPDFHLLEDLSRRYQHFAALKVLSSKRRRPLDANRLFDAVDDSRPECYIHSQVRQSQAKPNNQDFDDFANSRQPTARPPELSSLGTCRSVGLEPSPAAAIPSFSLDWIGRH
eukprot:s634_g6.t1